MSPIEFKPDFKEKDPRDHDSLLNLQNRNGMHSGIELMCPISPPWLPGRPCYS